VEDLAKQIIRVIFRVGVSGAIVWAIAVDPVAVAAFVAFGALAICLILVLFWGFEDE
jgi:hypothetical protein